MRIVLSALLATGCLAGCGAPEEEDKSEILEGTTLLDLYGYQFNIDSSATAEISCNPYMMESVTNDKVQCKSVTVETDYGETLDERIWTIASPDGELSIQGSELDKGQLIIDEKTNFCWMFYIAKTYPRVPSNSSDYKFMSFTLVTEQNDVTNPGSVDTEKISFVAYSSGDNCIAAK